MNTKTIAKKIDAFIKKNYKTIEYIQRFRKINGVRPRFKEKDLGEKAIKSLSYSPKTSWKDIVNTLVRRFEKKVGNKIK